MHVGRGARWGSVALLGRPLDAGLAPTILPLAPESWDAGSHKVNCMVGKFDGANWVDLPGPLR